MGPKQTYEGYLRISHSGPGLPDDVARRAGYLPEAVKAGKTYESATLSCRHCRVSVVKNPLRKRERNTCAKCNFLYVCDVCAAQMRLPDYDHTPFEKFVEKTFEAAAPRGLICI